MRTEGGAATSSKSEFLEFQTEILDESGILGRYLKIRLCYRVALYA